MRGTRASQAGRSIGAGLRRCAIYTRKSTDEGLDQEFNSLDAQREACAAYILSQRHEGWILHPELYDDGGYSGGSLDRPALRQLLAAVKAGEVDVIVVYKVDRLTRSLADFAKIVEVLDAVGASFVSVTQAFNTTSSMGRLTLNVLLSFAQFEREVTSERIRDKIAASKAKGMWMGGPVPFGYQLRERRLVPCPDEAPQVRLIFEQYLALGSITKLEAELARRGLRTRIRTYANGRIVGGATFRKGMLAVLLQNPIYIGEVSHKGTRYRAEHEQIVDRELWERAQVMFAAHRHERRSGTRAKCPSLLAGMLFDRQGRATTSDHATKGSRRYRYYVSQSAGSEGAPVCRLPAGEVEQVVCQGLTSFLVEPVEVIAQLQEVEAYTQIEHVGEECRRVAEELQASPVPAQRALLQRLALRAELTDTGINLRVNLAAVLNPPPGGWARIEALEQCLWSLPVHIARRGNEVRLVFVAAQASNVRRDPKLVRLIASACVARERLKRDGAVGNGGGLDRRHLHRLGRLAFLPPDVVTSILDGTQPVQLTARDLLRTADLPLDWVQQRHVLGLR